MLTHAFRRHHRGFTLLELFAVTGVMIALTLLLLCIPPPYYSGDAPRQGNCMSNIKALIQGLKMYRDDYGVCPEALYGISYDGVNLETRLYPNFVKEPSTFVCSQSPIRLQSRPEIVPALNRATGAVSLVAAFSSYDAQLRNPHSRPGVFEQHYATQWERQPLGRNRRQLADPVPSDDTVVTWCLYHAKFDHRNGVARPGTMAIVGFWDGRVQKLPAERLSDWSDATGRFPWQVLPKP